MTKEKGAMHKQTIRVVYPTCDSKMVLRTEQNWDANIEPVGQNDCVSKFAIETERPYFYFKPVLLRDNTAQWSRGENFLGSRPQARRSTSIHTLSRTPASASAR